VTAVANRSGTGLVPFELPLEFGQLGYDPASDTYYVGADGLPPTAVIVAGAIVLPVLGDTDIHGDLHVIQSDDIVPVGGDLQVDGHTIVTGYLQVYGNFSAPNGLNFGLGPGTTGQQLLSSGAGEPSWGTAVADGAVAGTTGFLGKFTSGAIIGDSLLEDDGVSVINHGDLAMLDDETVWLDTLKTAGLRYYDGTSFDFFVGDPTLVDAFSAFRLQAATARTFIQDDGDTVDTEVLAVPGVWSVTLKTLDGARGLQLGVGGLIANGQTMLMASYAAYASLNFPAGVAPDSPNGGDLWNDGDALVLHGLDFALRTDQHLWLDTDKTAGLLFDSGDAVVRMVGTAQTVEGTTHLALYDSAGQNAGVDLTADGVVVTGAVSVDNLLSLAAATTGHGSLVLPDGTAPTTPTDGLVWRENGLIKVRVGSVTKTLMFR
jgi:hypothetical protein